MFPKMPVITRSGFTTIAAPGDEVAEDLRYRLKICARAIQELDTEMQNINNAIAHRNADS